LLEVIILKEQEIRKQLAGKLHFFRQRAGLTAKEVGEKIGKSDKTVSGWEHGRGQPDADMLFLLCEIYGIKNISEFYTNDTEQMVSPVSQDERELLTIYRNLNKEACAMLLSTARAFAGNPDMQKDGSNHATA